MKIHHTISSLFVLVFWVSCQNNNYLPLGALQLDPHGRIAVLTYPGGNTCRFAYEVWNDSFPLGVRQVRQKMKDREIVTELDPNGHRIAAADGFVRSTYRHDEFGRLTAANTEGLPELAWEYDLHDRPRSVRIGGQPLMAWEYDFAGRVSKMRTPAGDVTYQYVADSLALLRNLPNGVQTQWRFNHDGSVANITHLGADRRLLARYEYAYRPDGLVEWMNEQASDGSLRQCQFRYDRELRLAEAAWSDGHAWAFAYDTSGHLVTQKMDGKIVSEAPTDKLGRLLSRNGAPAKHDPSGNLAHLPGDPAAADFEFFADNRLKKASAGSASIEYRYDADGFPLARSQGGKQTFFVNDPMADTWRPLAFQSENGSRSLVIWEGSTPLGMIAADGSASFFLHDRLQSVRAVCDQAANLRRQAAYSPFGMPLQAVEGEEIVPGFTGLFYDPAAKLCLTPTRAYSPALGRFLQIDPVTRMPDGGQADLGVWAYCGGDPVNGVDLTGTQTYRPYDEYQQDWFKYYLALEKAKLLNEGTQDWWSRGVAATILDIRFAFAPGKPANLEQYGHSIAALLPKYIAKPVDYAHTALDIYLDASREDYASAGTTIGTAIGTELLEESLKSAADDHFAESAKYGERFFRQKELRTPKQRANTEKHLKLAESHSRMGQRLRMAEIAAKAIDPIMDVAEIASYGNPLKLKYSEPTAPNPVPYPGKPTASASKEYNWVAPPEKKLYFRNPRSGNEYYDAPSTPSDFPGGPGGPPGGGDGGHSSSSFQSGFGGYYPMSHAPVGGIRLSSASAALQSLGNLSGIALDDNGRLVLLGEKSSEIALPPLRLEDVATIFRSVYEHGTGPFVSIDPDPKNNTGPLMLIRHDGGTKGTYPGWVLFECDRAMKAYSMGKDNVTKKPLTSRVPGYQEIRKNKFERKGDGQTWERYWIVPGGMVRKTTADGRLSLLEVPMRVNTERMVWQSGKLVTAANPTPSPFAKAFSEWFSNNYDAIAAEWRSVPPPGFGSQAPVAVFAELKRLALIAAIAEQLKSQGEPMPGWLLSVEIPPVKIAPTTPSLSDTLVRTTETSRSSYKEIIYAYGGCDLMPKASEVKMVQAATFLERLTLDSISRKADCEAFSVQVQGKKYKAVALPGVATAALDGQNLQATDLVIPIETGFTLSLTRRFQAGAAPGGEFGAGWTLDLPFLLNARMASPNPETPPVFQVSSPLQSVSQLGRAVFVGEDPRLSATAGKDTLSMVKMSDLELVFNQHGKLRAMVWGERLLDFQRNAAGEVAKIVAWKDRTNPSASIELTYENGRVAAAKSSDGKAVRYVYSQKNGVPHLAQVLAAGADVKAYEYDEKGKITAIASGEQRLQLKHDLQGRLTGEQLGDEAVQHIFSTGANGETTLETRHGKKTAVTLTWDAAMRPVRQSFADGSNLRWEYGEGADVRQTMQDAAGRMTVLAQTADARHRTLRLPEGGMVEAFFDETGNLTKLMKGGKVVREMQSDGSLSAGEFACSPPAWVQTEGQRLLAVEVKNQQNQAVAQVFLDSEGKPVAMTDRISGAQTRCFWDGNRQLAALESSTHQWIVERNGFAATARTNWGEVQTFETDAGGLPKTYSVQRSGKTMQVTFGEMGPTVLRRFDGAELQFSYAADGTLARIQSGGGTPYIYVHEPKNDAVQVSYGGVRKSFRTEEDGGYSWALQALK